FEGSGTDDTTATTPEDPEGSGTDTTDTPATTKQGPCDSSPCIGDSTCEARFDGTFVCICRPGLVYNQISGCIQTKIFPGSLTLSEMFKPEMTDRKSEEFQIVSNRIENELSIVLNGNGYIRSIVLSLSITKSSFAHFRCPFGYAGFNCNDPYLLVVIVVSTVLGALLIIFIVALIVVSFRNQKEDSSSEVDFSSSYGNKELHKPTGIPRIPRANPEASWKSNNLEMTDSGSNHALVIRDRPESKARYTDFDEDMSYRGHAPPAYSGYGN
ncbi:hypothetical protein cypCar_00022267, partial [Cyprinus carpio]